jgi:hypothetical protein
MDLGALAPDEEVMSLDALAPDAAVVEEPVMDLGALAPDEEVMSLDALAPDAAVVEEPVMDLAALAPSPSPSPSCALADAPPVPLTPASGGLDYYDEPVFDLDTLAPTGAGLAASAPPLEPPTPASPTVEEAVDIAFLSPDQPDAIVIDLDALRPESTPAPAVAAPPVEKVASPAAAPPPVASAPVDDDEAEAEAPAAPEEQGQPVFTRTLAELYAAQGATKQAVDVLKHLHAQDPADADLGRRIAELEAEGSPLPAADLGAEAKREAEVEALARDLAESGQGRHDVDTPFAWTDEEPESSTKTGGPTIREYFDGLLNWEPRGGA